MGVERTLAILKPDCVRKNVQGEVISRIQKAGFRIMGIRQIHLTDETAGGFYAVHKERPFYKDLVAFMTSGPCWPIALERENAVADFRKLIGATDPKEAEEGTVRKLFADSKEQNIVHGSDAVDTAKDEIAFFFPKSDLL